MIILPNNKEDENLDGVKSPSSYLKAKSLEKKILINPLNI